VSRTQYDEIYPGADLSPEECQFAAAMLQYQQKFNRRYPAWKEVLRVALSLGYRKIAAPEPVLPPSSHKFSNRSAGPASEVCP
jgi:hypothetical protein